LALGVAELMPRFAARDGCFSNACGDTFAFASRALDGMAGVNAISRN